MNITALAIYSASAFSAAAICFLIRVLLLKDSRSNKISRAAEYVGRIEISGWTLMWYGISVTFTIVNRWVFSYWHGGFPYPTLLTTFHMGVKLLLSRVIMRAKKNLPQPLERRVFWRTAAPIGILTALDVLLSNASLMFITVTFYTIVKTGTLMWTLLWAVILQLEPARWVTASVVFVICVGISMASWGEVEFSLTGLILVLGAGCVGGLRWALTQLLLQADSSCKDPLVVLYHIAPASFFSMLPLMLMDLKPWIKSDFFAPVLLLETFGIALGGGSVAYTLVAVEIHLVGITSSLTLGVLGQVKELVQIGIAMLSYGDVITILNASGLGLAFLGTLLYKKTRKSSKEYTARYAIVDQDELHIELDALKYIGADWDAALSDGWEDLNEVKQSPR